MCTFQRFYKRAWTLHCIQELWTVNSYHSSRVCWKNDSVIRSSFKYSIKRIHILHKTRQLLCQQYLSPAACMTHIALTWTHIVAKGQALAGEDSFGQNDMKPQCFSDYRPYPMEKWIGVHIIPYFSIQPMKSNLLTLQPASEKERGTSWMGRWVLITTWTIRRSHLSGRALALFKFSLIQDAIHYFLCPRWFFI